MSNRRSRIARAGIRILASRGVRALTHRAIDEDLDLPPGSTSYYARTRRDLINLIVQRLSTQALEELAAHTFPDRLTVDEAVTMAMTTLDTTAQRSEEHTARLLLLLECRNDTEIRAALTTFPTVNAALVEGTRSILERLGIDEPHRHAPDLLGLVDAMLMQRIIQSTPMDERAVLRAYLTGLPHTSRDSMVDG
ncbi:TetR family transcriptional regulator [Stackebrandtia endophytica]|uniref:TetR family transcriptional regulator n=1 Tax=Stackebrandtia endophytica TaxID=1496996 RepID=A0A543ASQ2_9ACTN|nr:TetR/AcrR family transcriptional regulator [Stackebrandtia endophytica]TQL75576.1 TetR family transcriptional regulator [Stackebrandtia endophytica]